MRRNWAVKSYYEGPTENQYEGWTEEEIERDLQIAQEKSDELTDWPDID